MEPSRPSRGPGSSVGIARLWAGRSGIESRWGRGFPPVQTGPPSLLYNGYRVYPGSKVRPGRAADHSPPSSAAVMEEQSYTSTHHLGHTGLVTGSLYLYLLALQYGVHNDLPTHVVWMWWINEYNAIYGVVLIRKAINRQCNSSSITIRQEVQLILYDGVYAVITKLPKWFLESEVFRTISAEKTSTHILRSITPTPENPAVYEIMWTMYGSFWQSTDDNTMRSAYWMSKATNTHSEYVILIASSHQRCPISTPNIIFIHFFTSVHIFRNATRAYDKYSGVC